MSPENFVYWLQGFLEISNCEHLTLDNTQIKIIQDHIELVLKKETPNYIFPTPQPLTTPYNPFITTPSPFGPGTICSTSGSAGVGSDSIFKQGSITTKKDVPTSFC